MEKRTYSPRNTSTDDTIVKLAIAASGGGIEEQERQGQREMLGATTLPSDFNHDTREDFEALGFTFGEPVPGDPMFQTATLPAGWKREGSDHAMWSYIVDQRGIRRVAVFYKAAFYDRSAHMGIENVGYSLVSEFIYGDAKTFTLRPDLTDDERTALHAAAEDYIRRAEEHPEIYKDRLPRAWQVITALS